MSPPFAHAQAAPPEADLAPRAATAPPAALRGLDAARASNHAGTLTALDALEAEAIHILREVAAQARNPVVLFSGGKDSICVLRLCEKAFWPAAFPFPLLHIDTGHNFPEVIDFRDARAAELKARLIVRGVEDAIAAGIAEPMPGEVGHNRLQIPTLLAALGEFSFDVAVGGARRDEEKARAKERIFSFRDQFGQWDPRRQRPELWDVFNARTHPGEQVRVFPLSNWTELDVWAYIQRERLSIPSIYFSHEREVVLRDGQWLAVSHLLQPAPGEAVQRLPVRVRTVGDLQCTGMVRSPAADLEAIVAEVAAARTTERSARADDRVSDTSMEDRKREGYF